jgi:hypothetical protein
MLRSTACTPKLFAMSGNAVAITVPSRNSIKNAPATNSAAGDKPRLSLPVMFSLIFFLPYQKNYKNLLEFIGA